MDDLQQKIENEEQRTDELQKKIKDTKIYMVLGGYVGAINTGLAIISYKDKLPLFPLVLGTTLAVGFLGIFTGAYILRRKYKKELQQRETYIQEQEEWQSLQKNLNNPKE